MRQGKLTNEQLQSSILSRVGGQHPDILRGAGVGEDCAVIRYGDLACVLSTDPITATTHHAGRLAVTVSVNDVASAGAEPLGCMLTILAPPQTTIQQIEQVITEAAQEAGRQGLSIIGGHTEVTDAVTRLVVSTTVIGRAPVGEVRHAGGAGVGDALIMTKSAAPEGTAILAQTYPDLLPPALQERALAWSDRLSVLPEGRLAAALGATAMHDATEGGILGAAWEMGAASNLGLEIDPQAIPIAEETRVLAAALGLDPLRLISSGVLLIAHPTPAALCDALQAAGIPATVIGRFLPGERGLFLRDVQGNLLPLHPPEGDELYRALERKD